MLGYQHMVQQPQPNNYIEPDVLLVHKPIGISSFDVLRRLRPVLGTKKLGHAGTLDPLARGLMIVGVNAGTKKMTNYLKLPKVYLADIVLGRSTTTGDAEGEITRQTMIGPGDLVLADVDQAVRSMVGTHTLPVPRYSAIKVDGKALYRYAREGKEPPRIPEKEMIVTEAQLIDLYHGGKDTYLAKVRLGVDSGAYVRTLAEELGRQIGDLPASLTGLYRVSIGPHLDQEAFRLEESSEKPGFIRAILDLLFAKRS
ncbi:hypothetical protein KC929_00325 [Patescibacteria group bacterium]|nr:hypothetical protein [Patescibacteria group bacterium]